MLSLPLTPDHVPVPPPSVIWPHLLHHKEAGSWRLTDNPILTLYGRQCRHTPPIMSYYHMFIEYLPCPKTSCNTSPRPAPPRPVLSVVPSLLPPPPPPAVTAVDLGSRSPYRHSQHCTGALIREKGALIVSCPNNCFIFSNIIVPDSGWN